MEINLRPIMKNDLHCADLHKTQPLNFYGHPLCRIVFPNQMNNLAKKVNTIPFASLAASLFIGWDTC